MRVNKQIRIDVAIFFKFTLIIIMSILYIRLLRITDDKFVKV